VGGADLVGEGGEGGVEGLDRGEEVGEGDVVGLDVAAIWEGSVGSGERGEAGGARWTDWMAARIGLAESKVMTGFAK
jgi:hypothetical protein